MAHEPVHFGILLSNAVDKKSFITTLLSGTGKGELSIFNNRKGVLFSDLTIAQVIEKEHRHDTIELSKSENRPLQTFSSGERRKVLLDHCLAQKPDYIILDHPFDHLDRRSRQELLKQFKALATQMSLIQLANREEDLLPFIKNHKFIHDNSFVMYNSPQANRKSIIGIKGFPKALLAFEKRYDSIVKFENVHLAYDEKPILKNISWEVKQGEFWQLVGPNGAGKSTMLALITGENPKGYGQNITIFDKKKGSGESIWKIKRKMGHFSTTIAELFQRHQTVEQMVLSGFFDSIGLYTKPSDLQIKTALHWLETIDMLQFRKVGFNTLSLGQQRLILIVRALIKQPPLLILDEPFEGLDHENARLVANVLNALIETTQITIMYVSHTIESALVPSHVFELKPTAEGSIGQVKY